MLPPRAYIFVGLNVVRALSIIGLLLVFSSSIMVMVDDVKAVNKFSSAVRTSNSTNSTLSMINCDYIEGSTVPNQPAGVFWAVLNHLLIIFQVVILMLSEIGWPYKFFDQYFPVLGSNFGLGAMGLFQCLIGATVLSHHVDDFALVSAFFLFAIGCLNIFLGLVFREKGKAKRSIFIWRNEKRQNNILPTIQTKIGERAGPFKPLFTGSNDSYSNHFTNDEKGSFASDSKGYTGFGWGATAETFVARKGLLISRPLESLPPYGSSNSRKGTISSRRSDDEHESREETRQAMQPTTFESSAEAI